MPRHEYRMFLRLNGATLAPAPAGGVLRHALGAASRRPGSIRAFRLIILACLLDWPAALAGNPASPSAGLFQAYARARNLQRVVALLPQGALPADWRQRGPEATLAAVADRFCAWQVEHDGTLVWYTPSEDVDTVATTKARFVSAVSEFLDALPPNLASVAGSGDAFLLEALPPRLRELALYAVAPTRPVLAPERIMQRALLPDEHVAVRPELRMVASFYAQTPSPPAGALLGKPVVLDAYKGDTLFLPCPFEFASKPGEPILRSLHQDYLTLKAAHLPQRVAAPTAAACPLWATRIDQRWEDRLAQSSFPGGEARVWKADKLATALGKAASCGVFVDRRIGDRQIYLSLAGPVDVLNLLCWLCNATGAELRVVDNLLFLGFRQASEVPHYGMSLAHARCEQRLLRAFVARAAPKWPAPLPALVPLATTTGFFDSDLLPQSLREWFNRVEEVHRRRDRAGFYPPLPEHYWVRLSMHVQVELLALVPRKGQNGEIRWQTHAPCSRPRKYMSCWALP